MDADYVVVGAGSAGCVVAAGLSETGAKRALLEAGPRDRDPLIHIPAGVLKLLHHPKINWNYSARPSPAPPAADPLAARQDARRHQLDQRHAVCARQSRRFRRLGADGLPRLELRRGAAVFPQVGDLPRRGDPDYRGQGGPLIVEDYRTILPLTHRFVEAAKQAGFPFTPISTAGSRRASAIRR